VVLVGLRGESAAVAVGAMMLAHALYKAPLFFVAGNIDHGTGTRIIDELGGLRRQMPWTAAAALLAAASLAGLPFSFGFVAKDVIGQAKELGEAFPFALLANTVFSTIAVAVAAVAAIRVFWLAPRSGTPRKAHEGALSQVLPPLVLASVGIVLGVFPLLAWDLLEAASTAMSPDGSQDALRLNLGARADFGALALGLLLGGTVFLFWDRLHHALEVAGRRIGRVGMSSHYERSLEQVPRVAAAATRWLQNGRLPSYVAWLVASLVLVLMATLWLQPGEAGWPALDWPSPGLATGAALVALGAVCACLVRDRLVMLLSVGLVGYGCAVMFLYLGAPDVAYTQLTVETVFVIVAAAVLLTLRKMGLGHARAEPVFRPGALLLSLSAASLLTVMLLRVYAADFDPALSTYFGEQSVPAAHGRNVVNVILVDFRAMDTFGEVAVVMLSLLAALPLLEALRRRRAARREAA